VKTHYWYVQRNTNKLWHRQPRGLLIKGAMARGIITIRSTMSPEKFAERKEKMRDFGLRCATNGEGLVRYAQAPGPLPLSEARALAAAFRNRFPEVARYFANKDKESGNGQ
jgi:hypothetical protein